LTAAPSFNSFSRPCASPSFAALQTRASCSVSSATQHRCVYATTGAFEHANEQAQRACTFGERFASPPSSFPQRIRSLRARPLSCATGRGRGQSGTAGTHSMPGRVLAQPPPPGSPDAPSVSALVLAHGLWVHKLVVREVEHGRRGIGAPRVHLLFALAEIFGGPLACAPPPDAGAVRSACVCLPARRRLAQGGASLPGADRSFQVKTLSHSTTTPPFGIVRARAVDRPCATDERAVDQQRQKGPCSI